METTYRSLGNLLFALLSDPDQLDAVRDDRTLLPQAIEEAVRWEPPLLTITRVATRDTELGGVAIPAGSSVMPMLGAANRQEDRYPDPDRFDIFRPARAHLGWGHGVHVCLGMHLARLEMRVALNLLFDRLPNLRLDPDGDDPHIRGQVFRSPTSLPVLFDVRTPLRRPRRHSHRRGSWCWAQPRPAFRPEGRTASSSPTMAPESTVRARRRHRPMTSSARSTNAAAKADRMLCLGGRRAFCGKHCRDGD